MTKSSFGIRIEDELVEKLSDVIDEARYLNITRSELIEAILEAELSSENPAEKISELIIRRREGRLNSHD